MMAELAASALCGFLLGWGVATIMAYWIDS